MCIFVKDPIWDMSKEKQQKMWDILVERGVVIVGLGKDPRKVDSNVLSQFLRRKSPNKYETSPPTFHAPYPPSDPEFDAIRAKYNEEWKAHQPNIINTSKTYTTKDKPTKE